MKSPLKKRGWLRIIVVMAAMYALLWAVTVVFGPKATRDLAQRRHLEYQTKNSVNPASSILVCNSISVPVPFIVNATWSTKKLMPDGRPAGSGTWDQSRTVWVFGWTRVVSERNGGVFCGVPALSK